MALPDKIRIPLEDYGTFQNVGRLPDGTQFLAYCTGAFPGARYPSGDDWRYKKRWLAVIHRFNAEGDHIGTETQIGGYDIEGRDVAGAKAYERLEEMFAGLTAQAEPEFCDIWVKLFSIEIDDVLHGLVYEQDEDDPELEWVMLEPRDIMFHSPWDSGDYST